VRVALTCSCLRVYFGIVDGKRAAGMVSIRVLPDRQSWSAQRESFNPIRRAGRLPRSRSCPPSPLPGRAAGHRRRARRGTALTPPIRPGLPPGRPRRPWRRIDRGRPADACERAEFVSRHPPGESHRTEKRGRGRLQCGMSGFQRFLDKRSDYDLVFVSSRRALGARTSSQVATSPREATVASYLDTLISSMRCPRVLWPAVYPTNRQLPKIGKTSAPIQLRGKHEAPVHPGRRTPYRRAPVRSEFQAAKRRPEIPPSFLALRSPGAQTPRFRGLVSSRHQQTSSWNT
jgi:hypothetical protein